MGSISRSNTPLPMPWDSETQMLVLKFALKCSDLGHLTSSIDVHKQWVARLEEVSGSTVVGILGKYEYYSLKVWESREESILMI